MSENKSNIWLSQHWLNQNEKDWWKFYGKLFLIKASEVLHGRCSVRFSLISIDTLDMLDTIQWIENLHICQSRRFRYWEPSLENPLSEIEREFQRTSTNLNDDFRRMWGGRNRFCDASAVAYKWPFLRGRFAIQCSIVSNSNLELLT